LCNPTPEFSDILWHPTNIYGPKVFLLTKIKPEYPEILYNPPHFPDTSKECLYLKVDILSNKSAPRVIANELKISIYSGWCLILHTKGPGKCGGLYRISGYSGFILVNRNTLRGADLFDNISIFKYKHSLLVSLYRKILERLPKFDACRFSDFLLKDYFLLKYVTSKGKLIICKQIDVDSH
jgi:hypothetical protein